MKLLDALSRFQKEYAKIGVRELVQNIGKEAHQDLRKKTGTRDALSIENKCIVL